MTQQLIGDQTWELGKKATTIEKIATLVDVLKTMESSKASKVESDSTADESIDR